MRVIPLILSSLIFVASVFAWDDADYEIFDLVSDIEQSEGKGTTFYSWLDLAPTASTAEISKAYRQKSLAMHPDKNPHVKDIQKRFARLGVIAAILRNKTSRERYDFFYKNGVPKWRGTGYYYSRYRPGLVSVLAFLVILTSGLQYMVQRINRTRDLQRIRHCITSARSAAWGPKMVALPGARKVRVNLTGGYNTGTEDDDYVPSKFVSMVVDGEDVFIAEGGELTLLDESAASQASISSTWFLALVAGLAQRATGAKRAEEATAGEESEDPTSSVDTSDRESPSPPSRSGSGTPVNGLGTSGRQLPASMAGGRRRKGTNKKR